MPLRVVIVGPGRVGAACGRRLAANGVELLGFIGRDPARAARAVEFAGAGAVLPAAAHGTAHAVLFAVGDGQLEDAVAGLLAAAPARSCSLWLHTSGSRGLDVFAAAAAQGARRGGLHPVAPFADVESGYRLMAGQPAVLIGDANALRLLTRLAAALELDPIVAAEGRRALYHAGCALAANGVVALRALVDDVLRAAGGLAERDAERLATALMQTALASAAERGPRDALSGPVLRGDTATVRAHVE
ncbi:MAG: DUF2520 domain-containing protein, partial [Planctomycetes bacterium]|nr:DUF2520 domain-containing protein [Planctomycetota bacterium]